MDYKIPEDVIKTTLSYYEGKLDRLTYLMNCGHELPEDVIELAVVHNCRKVLKFLLNNGYKVTEEHLKMSTSGKYVYVPTAKLVFDNLSD